MRGPSEAPEPGESLIWRFLRGALFGLDAERAHRIGMEALAAYSRICRVNLPAADAARHPALRRPAFGLDFPNPLGLAAGFDKDAEAVGAWQSLGFGFVEVGTVTAHPQPGNPRPRLFRLPEDDAILNRLGFNNLGAAAAAERIASERLRGRVRVPLGVNIGKSKLVENERAAEDYLESFSRVADVADYVTVNVSSPNTPGLRDLQTEEQLARLLDALVEANAKRKVPRPLLLKLAPDLDDAGALSCAETAVQRGLAGLIIANTTISRAGLRGRVPDGPGGISGRPLFERSTALLRLIHERYGGRIVLVGVGGIMEPANAIEKLRAGAALIQVYTGFVYGGPGFPRRVLRRIAEEMGPCAATETGSEGKPDAGTGRE